MVSTTTQLMGPRVILRALLPAACSVWLVWLLIGNLSEIDLVTVQNDVSAFDKKTWLIALCFSWISFLAVSRYDQIATKLLGLAVPKRRAISMGWKATALSQIVGFGLITGAIVRWLELSQNPGRDIPKTPLHAFTLTATVSALFLTAWSVIALSTAIFMYLDPLEIGTLSLAALIVGSLVAKSSPDRFAQIVARRQTALHLVFLTLVDTFFAALVIYTFLPEGLVTFSTVYLAFLLSYVVGLISGLPGGLGPFELGMVMLLPGIDPMLLVPALVAFRIVYFAIPAILAVGFLGTQITRKTFLSPPARVQSDIPPKLRRSAPPEADLLGNSNLDCLTTTGDFEGALVLQSPLAIVQLGNPFGGLTASTYALKSLLGEGLWSKRSACIYRCNTATAMRASSLGMKAFRFSSEAIIYPNQFDLSAPPLASLRRKMRKAVKAGVTINPCAPDLEKLAGIDKDWVTSHGKARGFSTGKFSVNLVKRQRIYVAYFKGEPVAFVSFSTNRSEWLLDLVRYRAPCPDGTIYALINQAIEDARLCSIATLSLGSVPFAPDSQPEGVSGKLQSLIFNRSKSLKGLYQFKKYFDPDWKDRYFLARTFIDVIRGGLTVLMAIYGKDIPDDATH